MLITLALMLGVAATQQPAAPAPADPPEIVVEGRRDVAGQVSDFVKTLTDVSPNGQIGRFDWAVCPAVLGLSERQNVAAAARMRAVAEAAAIPVAKPGCKTNALLIVTADKPAFVSWLRSSHPSYFEGVPPAVMRQVARADHPAAAWHVQGLLDADGVEVPRDRETGQYIGQRTDTPSRISTTTRPHFAAAIVVVDSKALDGLTIAQLADYAAMRAFAEINPPRAGAAPAPTILDILDAPMDSAVPITLTQWDLAYLKALYASTSNRRARQQQREMSQRMTEDLGKPSSE